MSKLRHFVPLAFCVTLAALPALPVCAGEPVCVIGASSASGQSIGTGGKAFAARVGGRTVLITTAHGLTELMGNSDARTLFRGRAQSIDLQDTAGRELANAGRCILQDVPGGYYTSDLLVFELPSGGGLDTYTMASTLPAPGSKVWVISKEGHNFGSSSGGDKFAGTVTSASPEGIMVRMDAPLTAYHSSGSPVVDDRGNVVGMLVGTANGRQTVGLNPSASILQRLDPRAANSGAASRASAGVARAGAQSRGAAPAASQSRGVQTYGRRVQTYR